MKRPQKVKIGKRDKELFDYLHSFKVARFDQIFRDKYPGMGKWGLYKRLERLEKAGYIKGHLSLSSSNRKAYNITRKAFREYISNQDERQIELKSDSISHDLELVDICYFIKKSLKVLEYIPENSIQTWQGPSLGMDLEPFLEINSDAAIRLSYKGGSYFLALEYESSRKYASRYNQILGKYYSNLDIPLVLYIFETEEVLNRVKNQEIKLFEKENPKIYYSTLDLVKTKESLIFKNRRDELIKLGE